MHPRRNGGSTAVKARNGFAIALFVALLALAAGPVAAAAAALVIESPQANSTTGKQPAISGTTLDSLDEVSVAIHEGSASGELSQPVLSASPGPLGGWSVTPRALGDGTYTAVAEQHETLGQETATSEVTFTVDASPPQVTLNQPPTPSNNTRPAFSGTASDDSEPVRVYVYSGSHAGGTPVAEATANGNGGAWGSSEATPELGEGDYTAVARQESSLGNGEGQSNEVHFEVITASPGVSLDQPETPSGNTRPAFSGNAEDTTTVRVLVYAGSTVSGTPVAEATASGNGGAYTTGKTDVALAEGQYTAQAVQESSLHNPAGESEPRTFVIVTASPKVTLNQPETPSKNTRPTFSGEASDTKTVRVFVYAGSSVGGTPVAEATAAGTRGPYTTGATNNELSEGEYTAQAVQESSLGNEAGRSVAVTFKVVTASPKVTLNQPKTPSNNTTPVFTGNATDSEPVTVKVYAGSSPTGLLEAEARSTGGGSYTTAAAEPALSEGTYTAIAIQPSSLGNEPGKSEAVTFTVITAPPKVTLDAIKTPSNTTRPSFSGMATDTTPVTIEIHEGSGTGGPVVSRASATGTGGAWASGEANTALGSGTYTAVATQASSLGNPGGTSNAITFEVDLSSPTVTIEGPPALSKDNKPTFSGTATDTTNVKVHVYNGAEEEIASASARPEAGRWSTNSEGLLASGTYSAVATQESSLGNPPGESARVNFTVNSEPPKITLNPPALRSNNRTPSFTGTASDTEPVVVHVYEGSKPEGTEVAKASATGTGGSFSTGAVSPELAGGKHTYTAVATQKSSLENEAGRSNAVTFVVDTNSPKVTLVQPASPSKDISPTFTGEASDTETVVVRVYEGTKPEGHEVAKASAPGTGGAFSTGAATPALASGVHTYTAIAIQQSSLGNGPGESEPVTFVVDTTAPKVTLEAPESPSKVTAPTFKGTASDTEPVTVHIYAGAKAEGVPVSSATATVASEAFKSTAASPGLSGSPAQKYTAVAEQPSSLGNAAGKSNAVSFVVDTTSPTVTLNQPKTPSNNTKPTFSGSASSTTPVEVHVYEGTVAEGKEVAKATAAPNSERKFSVTSPALGTGIHSYTAVAIETSPLGNPQGESAAVRFLVDTQPPEVKLVAPPPLSGETSPTFEGESNDTKQVTVNIYRGVGKKAEEGKPYATATAPGSGGSFTDAFTQWTSGKTSRSLEAGQYTAIAVQESSLGNADGKSAPAVFFVDPSAPDVELNTPPALSNDASPSFTGTTTDTPPVTVEIFRGATTGAEPVSSATTAGDVVGNTWKTEPAAPPLTEGEYTALAKQESRLAGHPGVSREVHFFIDASPPQVSVDGASLVSSGTEAVTGAAGNASRDIQQVTVQLFGGGAIEPGDEPIQTVAVSAGGGRWSATFGGLAPGSYAVRALQRDQADNTGVSNTLPFSIEAPAPAPRLPPPSTSFSWIPANPRAGQSVSLIAEASDPSSAITGFAWDTTGSGAFAPGGPDLTTTFASAGSHTVSLRVGSADGQSTTVSKTIPVGSRLLPLMQPFPVVRITSLVTRRGTKVELLSVMAPPGALITVRCSGRRCPARSARHAIAATRPRAQFVTFRRFEHLLAPRVTLRVTVTKAGTLGKWTKLVVRSRKLPRRRDACVEGTIIKPTSCAQG
jgi:Bacterial Ig-like domain/PKD domain